MIRVRLAVIVAIVSACAALPARADEPATAPATQPAAPPYTLIVPAGMQKITVGDETAVAPPEYADAARAGLAKVAPTSLPSTTPSTMLDQLANVRAALVTEMSADLLAPQDKVQAFLDGPVKDDLSQHAALHADIYVIIATQEQLNAAGKSGWTAPLFHYNIVDQSEYYEPRVVVSTSHPMDDIVLWFEVKAGKPDSDISSGVGQMIHVFRGVFATGTSEDAMYELRSKISGFIDDNVVKPLNLLPGEQWLGLGIKGAMACKYMSQVTGITRSALSASVGRDTPNNPIRSAPLDLLHEFDPSSIKPDFMPYYMDALARKSCRMVQKVIDKSGDEAIAKLLTALKASLPPDNASLVALIQSTTGVDLTADLQPPAN